MLGVHTFDLITCKGSDEEIVWADLQQVSDLRENPWRVQRELQ
jgi:hypothetical protein